MTRDFDIPYIEDAHELNLDIDNLVFNMVDSIETAEVTEHVVHDLHVENQHNYITELGLVHNGGGIA